ncbi:MAG TPA: hypothetical protein VLF43_02815, partial [Candidatus Saccharimonadales bacterium]|nr:hypothetical protein [Candidatus Saccharimonadales bacterium]
SLETQPDFRVYGQEIQQLHERYNDRKWDETDKTHLAVSSSEHELLWQDAVQLLGPALNQDLGDIYVKRFPTRTEEYVLQNASLAHQQAVAMLQGVLMRVTQLPRLRALDVYEQRRDAIFAQVMGKQWRRLLDSHSTVAPNVLSELQTSLNEQMFYELPVADYARMPPSWREAIGQHYAGNVAAFSRLLMEYRSTYLTKPYGWPHGGAGLALSLFNGTVEGLRADIESEPRVRPTDVIDRFILHGGQAATEYRLKQQASQKAAIARSAAELATRKATILAREKARPPLDPQEERLQELLKDPEVQPELANLTVDSVIRIGSEGETIPRDRFDRIITKHVDLVALTLRKQALADPDNAHPKMSNHNGFARHKISIPELLAGSHFGKRESAWFAVLPVEETYLSEYFKNDDLKRIDTKYVARLCVAADLQSSGKPPVTNMLDALLYVRRNAGSTGQSAVALMLRRPTGVQGTEYVNHASRLASFNAVHVVSGGLPGSSRKI